MSVLVYAAAVVVLIGVYLSWTANRLDRLHTRRDAAWAALDAQLVRRASVSLDLAASRLLDPAASILLDDAAHTAREAAADSARPRRDQSDAGAARRLRGSEGEPRAQGAARRGRAAGRAGLLVPPGAAGAALLQRRRARHVGPAAAAAGALVPARRARAVPATPSRWTTRNRSVCVGWPPRSGPRGAGTASDVRAVGCKGRSRTSAYDQSQPTQAASPSTPAP